jgi:hypothetical protein
LVMPRSCTAMVSRAGAVADVTRLPSDEQTPGGNATTVP